MRSYVKFMVYVLCALFITAGGCGKKDTAASADMKPEPESEKPEVSKEDPKEQETPEPEPEKEKEPVKKDTQPVQKEGDSEKEAEALYQKIMDFKKNSEYQQALNEATDLMSRLPKTSQAQKVIPVYHELKKLLSAKRSCDEYYDLLRQATEIRDRYAAEKFFLQNTEVGGIYLTDKLHKSSDRDFATILGMLAKMNSTNPVPFLADTLLDNSRPKAVKEICEFFSKQNQTTVKDVFLKQVQNRKEGKDQLTKVICRVETPEVLVTLGRVYGALGLDDNDILTGHISMACSKEGADFFRECVMINGILEHAFDSRMAKFAEWVREKKKDDVISLINQMNKKITKASIKGSMYKKHMDAFASRFLLLPEGVIAHYPLDGNGKDSQGKNNGKAAAVKPAQNRAGREGAALHFHTDRSSITVAHSSDIEMGKNNSDFSVSFWLCLLQGANGNWRIVIHKGVNSSQRTPALWLHPDSNRFHFRISTTANYNEGGDSTFVMPLKKWTHIVYVKEKNKLKLYINGALDSTADLSAPVLSNNGPFYIGFDNEHVTLLGMIDELIIFSRALSAEDISSLFKAGIY